MLTAGVRICMAGNSWDKQESLLVIDTGKFDLPILCSVYWFGKQVTNIRTRLELCKFTIGFWES